MGLGEGEAVHFSIVNSIKGLKAYNVTGPNGARVEGSKYSQPNTQMPNQQQRIGMQTCMSTLSRLRLRRFSL
jgi:hypothetical protein